MILLRVGIGLAVLYIAFGSYVWWAMQQPPEKFAEVVSRHAQAGAEVSGAHFMPTGF